MTENEVCIQYMPLIHSIARGICSRAGTRCEYDDLVSEGAMGLVRAWRLFDPKRGTKFDTYATHKIRGSMLEYIRRTDWVPRLARRRFKQAQKARDRAYAQTGRRFHPYRPVVPKPTAIGPGGQSFKAGDESRPRVVLNGREGATALNNRAIPKPHQPADSHDAIRSLMMGCSREEKLVVLSTVVHGIKLKDAGAAAGISESRACQVRQETLAKLRLRLHGTM